MTVQGSFFNTINLSGPELKEAVKDCRVQDANIMIIMHHLKEATPIKVHDVYSKIFGEILLQSVRRSLSVLTDMGKLEMTDDLVMEKYGRPNHKWKIKTL